MLPGYVSASELPPKGKNHKLENNHSRFLQDYAEQHPTCYVEDAMDELWHEFTDLSINHSTVY